MRPRLLLALFLLPVLAAAQAPCDRGGCGRIDCGTPARPAPPALWAGLKAIDPDPLPKNRDSTSFDEFHQTYDSVPWFESLDAENGFVFAGLAHGLQVWDGRSGGVPVLLGQIKRTAWKVWSADPHAFHPLHDVDAPAGVDSLVAIVGQSGTGIAVIDTSVKTAPRLKWQFAGMNASSVYAATIAGRHYAFVGSFGGAAFGRGGLRVFDMDAPAPATGVCSSPADCPGLYVGELGTMADAHYVDGVDSFVVVSQGTARGVEIWDVSSPRQPRRVLRALDTADVFGVALWREWGSTYYLGVITDHFVPGVGVTYDLQIYGVDCVATACSGLEAPLSVTRVSGGSSEMLLTFSRSGDGKPFLYASKNDACNDGFPQREFLFDVSDPTHPVEVGGAPYWDWYYRGSATGFNKVAPLSGQFVPGTTIFARAAHTIMDAHQLVAGGPVAPPEPPPVVTPPPPPIVPPVVQEPPGEVFRAVLVPVGCAFGFCSAEAGHPLGFTSTATGTPDLWEYDWNGDGTFEQASREPIPSHTYAAPGTFSPSLRVRRGSEVAIGSSPRVIITAPATPPPPPVVEPPPVEPPPPTCPPEKVCDPCPPVSVLVPVPDDIAALLKRDNRTWTRRERNRIQSWILGIQAVTLKPQP